MKFLYFFIVFIVLSFCTFAKDIKYIKSTFELISVLKSLEDNDNLILKSGVYIGNFKINKNVNISTDGYVLLTSNKNNDILNICSKNVSIKNIIFYNSGKDLSYRNSCIYVNDNSNNVMIVDNIFSECGFGIWINESGYAYVLNNIFVGTIDDILSFRGNTIQLHRNNNTVITNNFILNGRDGIYISSSKEVSIYNNIFINTRFGIHYMYSNKCSVMSNIITRSLIGAALMSSRYVDIVNNFICFNINHGLFFRDVMYSRIFRNKSLYNMNGMYFGGCHYNDIINNDVIKNYVGAKITAGSNENLVYDNNFANNQLQINFLDNRTIIWNTQKLGNFWSHYVGWDLNCDNIGDKKFYVTNVSNRLFFNYSVLRIMFNSPGLILLQKIENQFPAFRKSSVVDNYPLIRPVIW